VPETDVGKKGEQGESTMHSQGKGAKRRGIRQGDEPTRPARKPQGKRIHLKTLEVENTLTRRTLRNKLQQNCETSSKVLKKEKRERAEQKMVREL